MYAQTTKNGKRLKNWDIWVSEGQTRALGQSWEIDKLILYRISILLNFQKYG